MSLFKYDESHLQARAEVGRGKVLPVRSLEDVLVSSFLLISCQAQQQSP
jgi:hypothetical protein